MKFKVGDKVRVINCHSGGNFDNGDIVTIAQIGSDYEDDVYGAISPHDGYMWYLCEDEVGSDVCECCQGDKPVFWLNEESNAFIDNKGEMSVMASGVKMKFHVEFCPICGYRFN